MKQTICLLIACCCFLQSYGQTSCNDLYKQALQVYREGNVQAAYDLLTDCIEARKLLSETERSTRSSIYWLATQSSILLKKNTEAKSYLKRMLALRPYYQRDKDDLQDMETLLEELVVKPRLSLRLMGGLTGSSVQVDQEYNVFIQGNGAFSAPKKYPKSPQLDMMMGAELQFTLNRYVSLSMGATLAQEQFSYKYKLTQGTIEYDLRQNTTTGSFDTIQTQTYSLTQDYTHEQSLTYLKVPISIQIHPGTIGRFEPYAEIGGYYGRLLNANKTVVIKEIDSYTVESATASLEQTEVLNDFFTTNIKEMLIVGTYGWFLGAGVNVKLYRTTLFVGGRFQFGRNNIVNQGKRYNFEDLTYDFYDVMDDLRINSGQVFFGWSIPISFKAFDKKVRTKNKN